MNKEKEEENLSSFRGVKLYIESPEIVLTREIRRSLLITIITLVIVSAAIGLITYEIKLATPKLQAKQNLIYTATHLAAIDSNLYQNWDATKPILEKIDKALPDPNNLLDYQSALEAVASESGVQISISFTQAKSASTTGISGTSFLEHQVQIKGTQAQIISFLGGIEKMPFYVTILNFNFNLTRADQVSGTVILKVATTTQNKTSSPVSPSAAPTASNVNL